MNRSESIVFIENIIQSAASGKEWKQDVELILEPIRSVEMGYIWNLIDQEAHAVGVESFSDQEAELYKKSFGSYPKIPPVRFNPNLESAIYSKIIADFNEIVKRIGEKKIKEAEERKAEKLRQSITRQANIKKDEVSQSKAIEWYERPRNER